MKIVFWQNCLSPHQAATIKSLAALSGVEASLVVEEELPLERRHLGWSVPDFGNTRIVVNPSKMMFDELIMNGSSETTHIFSGTRSYALVWNAFKACLPTDARIAILSEASDWRGVPGLARVFRARKDALQHRSRVDFLLAIGHLATRWFKMAGYPDSKIYPFGYFVEKPLKLTYDTDAKDSKTFNITFIGQCVSRKGVDILIDALATVNHLDWRLQIIGDGIQRADFEELSKRKGMFDRISFMGVLDNSDAMQVLTRSDLLVLPSRWDGWGAVVNEALMRGVRVVCSDFCGAAGLLQDSSRGAVFKSGDVTALSHKLKAQIMQGPVTRSEREKLITWSQRIRGDAAANYLMGIIKSSSGIITRVNPPWIQ